MKLYPSQLAPILMREVLPKIFLLHGDDPILTMEIIEQIRHANQKAGYQERLRYDADCYFNWSALPQILNTRSLFPMKQQIEFHILKASPSTINTKQTTYLLHALKYLADDKHLLIIAPKLDSKQQKTKWFLAVEAQGIVINAIPLLPHKMMGWINNALHRHQLSLSADAKRLLLTRCSGNLLAIQQCINCLAILYPEQAVNESTLENLLDCQPNFDCFHLLQAICCAQQTATYTILEQLQQKNTPILLILHLLIRQVRQLWQIKQLQMKGHLTTKAMLTLKIWPSQQATLTRAAKRLSFEQLKQAIFDAQALDQSCKNHVTTHLWIHLQQLCLRLTQRHVIES